MVIVSMFEELALRDVLPNALQGRNEDTLEPILRFLIAYISDPRYGNTLADISARVIGTLGVCSSNYQICMALL